MLRRALGHGVPLHALVWYLLVDPSGLVHVPGPCGTALGGRPVSLGAESVLSLPPGLSRCSRCALRATASPPGVWEDVRRLVHLVDGGFEYASALRRALDAPRSDGAGLEPWLALSRLSGFLDASPRPSAESGPLADASASLVSRLEAEEARMRAELEVRGPAPVLSAFGVDPEPPWGGRWSPAPSRFVTRGAPGSGVKQFVFEHDELLDVVSMVWGVSSRFGFEVLLVPERLAAPLTSLGSDILDCGPAPATASESTALVEVVLGLEVDVEPDSPLADPVALFAAARSLLGLPPAPPADW